MDVEGYELNVLEGFGDFLKNVKIIQLEYGSASLDTGVRLIDYKIFLEENGFHKFAYLNNYDGIELINNFNDHYKYCNIVCINKNSDYIPY